MMKSLSVKLDEKVFKETDEISSSLKLPRNSYIHDALALYNEYNKRQILKKKLHLESGIAMKESLRILAAFEKLYERIEAF